MLTAKKQNKKDGIDEKELVIDDIKSQRILKIMLLYRKQCSNFW